MTDTPIDETPPGIGHWADSPHVRADGSIIYDGATEPAADPAVIVPPGSQHFEFFSIGGPGGASVFHDVLPVPPPASNPLVASMIRTVSALIVGLLLTLGPVNAAVAWLGTHGIESRGWITAAAPVVVTAVYYWAVRALEQINSRWGWLLGKAAAPVYPTARR